MGLDRILDGMRAEAELVLGRELTDNELEYMVDEFVINWDEGQHPRRPDGKFGDAGADASAKAFLERQRKSTTVKGAFGEHEMTKEGAEVYGRLTRGEKLQVDAKAAAGQVVSHLAEKAKALGGVLWNRMNDDEKNACRLAAHVGLAVEHHLNSPAAATHAMVDEISKARGFNEEQSRQVRTSVRAADAALANTINIPLVHQGLEQAGLPEHLGGGFVGAAGTFLAAKVGYYTPVASAAYIAASAVAHPMATMRAAKALVGKAKYSAGHGLSFGKGHTAEDEEHSVGHGTAGEAFRDVAASTAIGFGNMAREHFTHNQRSVMRWLLDKLLR